MRSKHNGVKIEINYRKLAEKSLNIWKLSSTLLNNPWVKEIVSRDIKKCTELSEVGNRIYQIWGHNESSAKREIYSIKCIP